MSDLLDVGYRRQIIGEILGKENRSRKEQSLKAFEVYMDRGRDYVMEQLTREFSEKTVKQMRTITSINLCKRIIDEQASIYKQSPDRNFTSNDSPLSEQEQLQVNNIYEEGDFNSKFKKANKVYKLQRQCSLQVVPMEGKIELRVLQPHHYDVVPHDINPEKEKCYILSSFDKSLSLPPNIESPGYFNQAIQDMYNQAIGDRDDYLNNLKNVRMVWWSDEFNFITNGCGDILGENGQPVDIVTTEVLAAISNPIGLKPFVDVSEPKDFEFFIRSCSSAVQFNIDFQILLSDISTINRLQGFAQAIIYSEKVPENMLIGPSNVLHIPQNPESTIQPRFEFASPSPDLNASLSLQTQIVSLFLSANGIDPKTISGSGDAQKFTSGLDRLLAMIDKFEASKDDIDLFKKVESKVLDLVVLWSNIFQGVNSSTGNTMPLEDELQIATLPEDVDVTVIYHQPQSVQTKSEKEDSAIKLINAGLKSRSEALMDLNGVTETQAREMLQKIDSEQLVITDAQGNDGAN